MCILPAAYPQELREDVVRVARSRQDGVTLAQIAKDIHEMTLHTWVRQADIDNGNRPGRSGEGRYRHVSELAADGIPVAVTSRVLRLARQRYYRWLACPVTDAEWIGANRADALFDAHRDGPEFGYRFVVDEARYAGQPGRLERLWGRAWLGGKGAGRDGTAS